MADGGHCKEVKYVSGRQTKQFDVARSTKRADDIINGRRWAFIVKRWKTVSGRRWALYGDAAYGNKCSYMKHKTLPGTRANIS